MPDFTLALLPVDITIPAAGPTSFSTAAPTAPVPTAAAATTSWEIVAVDMAGVQYATFPTGKVTQIQWTLDGSTTASFSVPIDAAGLSHLRLANALTTPTREVQIYRNGHLIFWGPCVKRRANSQDREWQYEAADPLWYLMHRNMGEATRHNYLTNGSFDSVLAPWVEIGSCSPTIDTNRFVLGGASVRVTGSGSGENFLRQLFTIHAGNLGLALFLRAWVYVDSFTVGAFGNRGAFIQRLGATGPGALDVSGVVDTNTALGTWLPLAGVVNMPPNTTETIEVRLYRWYGTGHWDAVTVTVMESLSFVDGDSHLGLGWDQVEIAQLTTKYLAGTMPVGNPYTKSNLQLPVAGALSGIKKERSYQFFDHQPGYQGGIGNGALDEWPNVEDGFDYRVDYDSTTKRTFRTYYPAVGRTWTEPFEYTRVLVGDEMTGTNWGIIGWDYAETIEGSATDICEMGGFGTGSGREEGAFFDDAALGGLTLELVESAPTGAPIDLLDSVAAQRGAQLAKPIRTPILTFAEPRDEVTNEVLVTLIGALLPGDIVPATVNDADVQMNDVYRVTQVTLDPESELLAVVVDP